MRETEQDNTKKKSATTGSQKMGQEELRRELQRVLAAIAEEGEFKAETIEKATMVLEAMRKVRSGSGGGGGRRKSSSPLSTVKTKGRVELEGRKEEDEKEEKAVVVPEDFVCPISGELMRDPVIVATGQTYDRPFIQAWLDSGNRTCPRTQQVLSPSTLIPNHLVRQMISDWGKTHGIQIPPYDNLDGVAVTQGERAQLDILLKKISFPSITEQKQAAKELRRLTKRAPSFRALLGEKPHAISQLVSPLSSPDSDNHPDLQEDVVTTILNLSIHDDNKKIVGDDPRAMPLLIDAVRMGGMGTRSNAAAALFTLSAIGDNKLKIGELGAFRPLIKLLEEGSPIAKKDAASAIFSLCMAHENKNRAIEDGVVRVLLACIIELTLVDESLAILAMIASSEPALEEICGNGGVACMLSVIGSSESAKNRENAAVVLYSICMYDRTTLREVREEENYSGRITWLAQNGTSRARRKATGILERLNRGRDIFSPSGTP